MAKRRLDVLLVDRGLAESPQKAQALVMAGQVTVDARPASKPGVLVPEDAALDVAAGDRYVGRGGEKLEHALRTFALDVDGFVAADIGSSTGGFTDALLQHGASRVYAVDVGKGQLDYRLRQDPRVIVMEGVNVRHLDGLPEPVDLAVIDVSFISLKLVLPVAASLLFPGGRLEPACGEDGAEAPLVRLKPDPRDIGLPAVRLEPDPQVRAKGSIVALFKPQFEARKDEVPRGGVIEDAQLHSRLIGRFVAWCVGNGLRVLDLTASPILGSAGNREFLLWLRPLAGVGKPRLRDVHLASPRRAGVKPAPTGVSGGRRGA